MKKLIRELIPPLFFNLSRNRNHQETEFLLWTGDYASWQDATQNSIGYNQSGILEACRESILKVKNGEAVYERDSVVFDKVQYSWPLLACLQNVALNENSKLHLIDFGGSLGSSYFQNRHFLKEVNSLRWLVVEQEHFVTAGRKEIQDDVLKFEYSIEDVLRNEKVNCLLLSGVLQYLSDPFHWIKEFRKHNFEYIIIDRTGFADRSESMLTIQNVPSEIYDASYPCWFFKEDVFVNEFAPQYSLVAEFNDSYTPSISLNGSKCYWKGFYFKRNR